MVFRASSLQKVEVGSVGLRGTFVAADLWHESLKQWGRIDYLLWDLGLERSSITQDVDFIHARRL